MSQATSRGIDECPACEGEDVDESVDQFDGICTGCGFVIHDSTEPKPPGWIVTETATESGETEDWLEYCTIRNATDKQLAEAFDAIERLADHLNLSTEARKEAAEIYCEAHRETLTDGRDTTSFVAACLHTASMRAEKPVPQRRLTETENVENRVFRSSLSALHEGLDYSPGTPRPVDYLPFVATRLNLSASQTEDTERILDNLGNQKVLSGKDPATTIAACAYLVTEVHTQADVARIAGVSSETIRLRVAQLRELMKNE